MTGAPDFSRLTFPQGFRAAAMAAGIKQSGNPDLSCVVSDHGCAWAFAGTRSTTAAACVTRNRELYAGGAPLRALMVNAGVANAATGQKGAGAGGGVRVEGWGWRGREAQA